MSLSLHGVSRLPSPCLSPLISLLTRKFSVYSIAHGHLSSLPPPWLPGEAKQGIALLKEAVAQLWHTARCSQLCASALSGCPGVGVLFPAPGLCHGLCLLWMPKLSSHSLEEVAALPQSIPGNPQLPQPRPGTGMCRRSLQVHLSGACPGTCGSWTEK